jgi:hypothetical protein
MILEKMQQKFGMNIKVTPAVTMYTKQFTQLGLLREDGDYIIINPITYDKEMLYVYAYALLFEWENVFPDENEITATQFNDIKFGAIYGWNNQTEYAILQSLCDIGVIGMNNQLVPFTIKKHMCSADLIEKLYSLLL